MEDLCQKLCTFYNTNILDDQNKEIKDEFLRVSLENLGTGEGKQTLMKLICNHFDTDPKPMPQFIGGPRNLTVHWSDEYQKMIYIFGEYNSDIIDCDDQAKNMPIEDFLGEFIRTTDKYLDIFIELPALSNKQTRKYHEKFLPLANGFRLAKLFDQFKECIEYPSRGGENCRLARVHYFDIRKKEDSEGFSDSTDTISYFTIRLQYLFNEAAHYNYTDKQFVKAFRSLIKKNKKIMTVLNFMYMPDNDKFKKFWVNPLTENEYINKELNALETDNPTLKNLIVTYVENNIMKEANNSKENWINNTNIVLKRIKTSDSKFCDTVRKILDDISSIYANVIDAYLLARVFKKFNMEEMGEKAYLGITDQPDRARNIIIYAGDDHSEKYRKFLKHVLHFKKIATTGVRGEGTKIYCIDMKSIPQPLFMYPKNKVLVLCQRKEGFTDKKISITDHLIPTLEQIIKTFLKEKMGNDTIDIDIKYMVDLDSAKKEDKSDFNMVLNNHSRKGKEFRDQHLEFYDLVVLQTCPFIYMDMKMVADILKDKGYLICTSVQIDGSQGNITGLTSQGIQKKMTDAGFTEVPDSFFSFQKKTPDHDSEFSIQTIVDKLISGGKDLSSNDRNSINKIIKKNLYFKNPSLLNQDYTNPVHRGIVIVLLLLCKNNPSSPFFPLGNRPEKNLVLDTIKKLEHNFTKTFIATK